MRGLFLANAECGYGAVSAAEQVERANRERWLAVQIETVEAVACVRDLVALDGVDMLFVGPADLSCALGVPGEVLHEKCLAALVQVSQACRDAGKPWGTLSRTPEHAQRCRELGCQLFSIAGDLDLIRRGLDATRSVFGDLVF